LRKSGAFKTHRTVGGTTVVPKGAGTNSRDWQEDLYEEGLFRVLELLFHIQKSTTGDGGAVVGIGKGEEKCKNFSQQDKTRS